MVFRKLIRSQIALSKAVDRLLPPDYSVDGHYDYMSRILPEYLRPNLTIYDIGGGKQPYLDAEAKERLHARVVGIDIDSDELARAPQGTYDETVTTDIAIYAGSGDADLAFCQAVLEHVRDTDGAIRAVASTLKPGGEALIFVPCRNAIFARINLLLPEALKRKVLFTTLPQTEEAQGFPSYYQDCTPSGLSRIGKRHGLEVVRLETYWASFYFYPFFPAYLLWRTWQLIARKLGKTDFCETFVLVLRKPSPV